MLSLSKYNVAPKGVMRLSPATDTEDQEVEFEGFEGFDEFEGFGDSKRISLHFVS